MLHPVPMQKIRIITLKNRSKDLIKELHEAGVLEIRKSRIDGLESGRPTPFFDEVSAQLVRLRGLLSILKKYKEDEGKKLPIIPGEEAVEMSKNIDYDTKIKGLFNEENQIREEISTYQDYLETSTKLKPFKNIDFSRLKGSSLDYRVGELPSMNIDKLNNKIGRFLDNYSMLNSEDGEKVVSLIIFRKKGNLDLEPILTEHGFVPMQIPFELTKPSIAASKYHNEIRTRENRMKDLRVEIGGLADSVYSEVEMLIESLSLAADRAEINSKFAVSSKTMIIEGWIREDKYDNIKKLEDQFNPDVLVEKVNAGQDEMPPTVLDNPEVVGPFEFLTRSYSFPNYRELDPSLIYLIFVPIVYGMIVGDVVYGLISIVIAKVLMDKFKNSNTMFNVARLWYLSAFPTIIFGIIFDEWFGMGHVALLDALGQWGLPLAKDALYHGFHRDHNLTTLIGITALVGLLQLGFGFILGFVNNWNHNRKHAYAKLAWLGIEIGGTLAVAALILNLIPNTFGLYGEVLLVISTIALFFTEGVAGILEIPGLMGNVLSYSRIAAIGIVGVILAKIINEYFLPVPSQGIFVILFIPLFVALHSANAFIAMFEALIQGGRLNLLEFRSKFFEGGGNEFEPFSLRSKK